MLIEKREYTKNLFCRIQVSIIKNKMLKINVKNFYF